MGSVRNVLVAAVLGVLLVAAALVLGAMSVSDELAMGVGTIGVAAVAFAAWPRQNTRPIGISWLVSFGATIALLWLGALEILQLDPPALAATIACVMVASLVASRLLGRK